MIENENLDIPDIRINEGEAEIDPGVQAAGSDDDRGSAENPDGGHFPAGTTAWRRKLLFWVIPTAVILSGSIGSIFLLSPSGESPKPAIESRNSPVPPGRSSVKEKIAFLGEFIFDQKDQKGRIRIAFCDIAIELENPQPKSAIADRVDLREAVFTFLKTDKGEKGLSKEGRNRLKENLKNELNRVAGENFVKNVYLTAYELH